ncbi:type Z 30S ribosomal protein S14 [Candidatus Gottesmanbacteria bacterium CG11_big_fil_rev_8_21_14_0_20_37_11]|uniref:Small ribosomal subunit protein uS14 n=2 Tax=Candidatus Gottesmaniibacteriota TaxID=1752720 RepID=A0A2M7RRG7_9BACT|nr:MAG: type Z 30S ribosomal protein S14 [Candidatus Gottesmanbacteria bacterium CG23_combo_of_CG06-09_8_20_14_all_37_19]PIR08499.1 MAG: type Z 30S ribosomal protein S14 [Candidatus Gottesmanbacteria bacterium CG11_big_fil_rev_8_21_14_0_20_37_11]PIZ02639.1 MAG: type Z 30S ribosomal protein S14 [Candidatus Gottesmanbacteria bacterium CG_4_10_14_0_8_um_filter_37_24]
MAKVSDIIKFRKNQKFTVRNRNRCSLCGRSRGYMRKFGLCRLCFRELAHKGNLPGVIKASW